MPGKFNKNTENSHGYYVSEKFPKKMKITEKKLPKKEISHGYYVSRKFPNITIKGSFSRCDYVIRKFSKMIKTTGKKFTKNGNFFPHIT